MFFNVEFRHTYPIGVRTPSYEVYIADDELIEDDIPEAVAVQFAIYKFYRDYILTEGSTLEVTSVKLK